MRLGWNSLVEIGQNVTIIFATISYLQLDLDNFVTISCVGHICDYFGVHPSMWTTFSLIFIQEEQFMSH
jgi:hypothetical protein